MQATHTGRHPAIDRYTIYATGLHRKYIFDTALSPKKVLYENNKPL